MASPVDARRQWVEGFVSAASAILVSEIGDKTFFIACLMAMRHSRLVVYLGAISALTLMTVLSALVGVVVPNVLSVRLTQLVAVGLFTVFGVSILYGELKRGCRTRRRTRRRRGRDADGGSVGSNNATGGVGNDCRSDDDGEDDDEADGAGGEMAEAAAALRAHSAATAVHVASDAADTPGGGGSSAVVAAAGASRRWRRCLNPVFVEALTLTFVAEWGDRSQLATIALAAAKNAVAVTLGGVLGHAICTGCAVVAGNIIAKRVSTRTINLIGGSLFLVFAVGTLYEYLSGTHAIERTHA